MANNRHCLRTCQKFDGPDLLQVLGPEHVAWQVMGRAGHVLQSGVAVVHSAASQLGHVAREHVGVAVSDADLHFMWSWKNKPVAVKKVPASKKNALRANRDLARAVRVHSCTCAKLKSSEAIHRTVRSSVMVFFKTTVV